MCVCNIKRSEFIYLFDQRRTVGIMVWGWRRQLVGCAKRPPIQDTIQSLREKYTYHLLRCRLQIFSAQSCTNSRVLHQTQRQFVDATCYIMGLEICRSAVPKINEIFCSISNKCCKTISGCCDSFAYFAILRDDKFSCGQPQTECCKTVQRVLKLCWYMCISCVCVYICTRKLNIYSDYNVYIIFFDIDFCTHIHIYMYIPLHINIYVHLHINVLIIEFNSDKT